MNRYLQLNFWGRVLSRIAFSLSISGPYLTVRHKSPKKIGVLKTTLGRLLSGSQAAHCSPSNARTEPDPGPLTLKGFIQSLREDQGAQCPQKWKLG